MARLPPDSGFGWAVVRVACGPHSRLRGNESGTMQFTENEPQSGKFARSALDRMAEHGIPASPANFTVWYSYVSARDPNLIGHLDEMLEQNTEFTSERNQEIYETFFGFSEEAGILRETGEQIRSQVMEIMSLIGQAGRDQSAYGEKLEGLSSGLDEQAGSSGS